MAEAHSSTVVNRPPDEVWAVLSDVGAISDWLPMIETSSFDGEVRRCTMAGAGEIVERILVNDDTTRTLEYTIAEAPFDVDAYHARWTVEPEGDGSRVTWAVEVEPADMAEVMGPVTESGVAALKDYLEARG